MNIIVAMDINNVIGKGNKLPWSFPEDLKYFKDMTKDSIVIMGRKTYESIGRELPGRINIILSKTMNDDNLKIAKDIQAALHLADDHKGKEIFIIGGANTYLQMLPLVKKLYITRINGIFEGDTYFPPLREDLWAKESSKPGKDKTLTFEVYSKREHGIPKKVFF